MAATATLLEVNDGLAAVNTTGSVSASAGDYIVYLPRDIVAAPAVPTASGLSFSEVTLTAPAINGAGSVQLHAYEAEVGGGGFSDTIALGGSGAFGYVIYKISGTIGVRQATGICNEPAITDPQSISFPSGAMASGSVGIAVWIVFSNLSAAASTPRTGWTEDADEWQSGSCSVAAQSRTTTDTAAEANYGGTAAGLTVFGVVIEYEEDAPPPADGVLQQGAGGYVGQWPFGLCA